MYKLIPGNNSYEISLKGEIISSNRTKVIPKTIDGKVTLTLFRVKRTVSVEWLAQLSHYEVNLTKGHQYKTFSMEFVKFNGSVIKSKTDKIMIISKPICVKNKYRLIPCFTNYAISKDGEVLDIGNDKIIKPRYYTGSYVYVYIYNPDRGHSCDISIHRLVALAWIHNDDLFNKVIVNHKNGNKHNYHKSNLEWTTYSYNNKHAFDNGLRTDNIPCKIRDQRDGEVVIFNTSTEACFYMGIDRTNLTALLNRQPGKLINKYWEFKLQNDNTPWFYSIHTKIEYGRYLISVIDENGIEISYPGISALLRGLNISVMRGWSINRVIERLKIERSNLTITTIDSHTTGPYQAKRISDSKIFENKTIRGLAFDLKLSFDIIRSGIRSKDNHSSNGYLFRNKSKAPWSNTFTKYKGSKKCIQATNGITKEVINFESLRKTARYFQVDRSLIKQRLDTNKTFSNWKFKEIIIN